ncbi:MULTISPECIES: response regulator transcription factor [unclassified Sphingomonas]|jgi:two-component system OmpR family response regulator|uniref:response regulator transcription factor n=1 Tax=unclassified Sphingomonas TaxID=196159 RepID=UPI0009E06474|nr:MULTISPECIES: response regulator transcription factor [unclassified Sphingomonas]MDY1007331.1 response regulator transcription factor [Sphingomonas sp. CFBP9019]
MYAMTHHILIVDDDPHIRDLLAFALGRAGMSVAEAGDGEAALAAVEQNVPDLMILDINMPRLDGLDLCRRLRASGGAQARLPILFLSSRDDEIDRIVGIEIGGDDYVVKPFSPREVVARVGAILKRGVPAPPPMPATVIRYGRLALDIDAWEARVDAEPIATTATEFQLLALLATMPSKVFSRDAIIDRLHGPGFAMTDRTVDSHVRNLRAKFARAGLDDLVETRSGVGYRLGRCG